MKGYSRLLITISILVLAALPTNVAPPAKAVSTILPNVGVWNDACLSANMTVADPNCAQSGTSLLPGTQVTVDINVTNAATFNGYDFSLFYDPTNLTWSGTNSKTGTVFSNPFVINNDHSTPGVIRESAVDLACDRPPCGVDNPDGSYSGGSGVLVQFTFNITGLGVSPFVLSAGTGEPGTGRGAGAEGDDWTRLILGGTVSYDVATSDGYFQNILEGKLGPVAKFTYLPASPIQGDQITFNASQSFDPDTVARPSIATYYWDFGDRVTIATKSPVISIVFQTPGYPLRGNFSVLLTVVDSDNHFEGMVTHLVRILPPPPICPLGLTTVRVPLDCPTIQSAIQSVVTGGTILVAPGTYTENPVITKTLRLEGAGNSLTIIQGGVSLIHAPYSTVSELGILNNNAVAGLDIEYSPSVNVSDNQIVGKNIPSLGPVLLGVEVFSSGNITLVGNTVEDEIFGVFIDSSPDSMLRQNTMAQNQFNFEVSGSYIQNVDTSNTVDGKPIFYGIQATSAQIPPDPGYIAIVNSHDIQVGPVSVAGEGQGVLVYNSTRVIIRGLTAERVLEGATILNSSAVDLENGVIQGCADGFDIESMTASNVTGNVFGCDFGMTMANSSSNIIAGNSFSVADPFALAGLSVLRSASNRFVNNQFLMSLPPGLGRGSPGLVLSESPSNQLTGNKIVGGLFITNSPQNTLRQNEISSGIENIGIQSLHIDCFVSQTPCLLLTDFVQNIDPSNTVDGKPVYYLTNTHNVKVPSNAGFIGIINSTNVSVKNVNLSFDDNEVLVVSSTNILIEDSNFTDSLRSAIFTWSTIGLTLKNNNFLLDGEGMRVVSSSNGLLSGNIVQSSQFSGITVFNSTSYTVEGNYINDYATVGILFQEAIKGGRLVQTFGNSITRNTVVSAMPPRFGPLGIAAPSNSLIVGNTIVDNFLGLAAGVNDTIYHNNFINNFIQARGSGDKWDNGVGEGNFWSDYKGLDLDGDGVGDTLLPHLGLDNYPLVAPWIPSGLSANLTKRAAWPEFKRLSISRSNETQTFNALALNTGATPEWVRAVFTVTSSTGTTFQLTSQPAWLEPGAIVTLTTSFSPLPGSYTVTVTLESSSDAYLRWNISAVDTFSFSAVP